MRRDAVAPRPRAPCSPSPPVADRAPLAPAGHSGLTTRDARLLDRHRSRRRSDPHDRRRAPGPRPSDPSVHRGRRHRPGHLAREPGGLRRRGGEGLRRQAGASPGWRSTPARRRSTASRHWLPDDTVTAFKEFLVGIKGPLTTPVGGGIRSLNVDAPPGARPLRLPAAGALLHRRAESREAARAGRHGDLPREHGGHLRRRRVGGRDPRGAQADRVPPERDGRQEDPLSRRPAASASSRSRARGPSDWRARPSSTRCATRAAASRSSTRATS